MEHRPPPGSSRPRAAPRRARPRARPPPAAARSPRPITIRRGHRAHCSSISIFLYSLRMPARQSWSVIGGALLALLVPALGDLGTRRRAATRSARSPAPARPPPAAGPSIASARRISRSSLRSTPAARSPSSRRSAAAPADEGIFLRAGIGSSRSPGKATACPASGTSPGSASTRLRPSTTAASWPSRPRYRAGRPSRASSPGRPAASGPWPSPATRHPAWRRACWPASTPRP